VGKYGTNLEGFGAFEGGVNADKGAPLVSTSSDGETALLFGPAALREIQAGVANGDFAIPPDQADAAISDENPLPYWTLSGNTSIVVTVANDVTAASSNVLQFYNPSVSTDVRYLTRYIAIPGALDRSFSFYAELYMNSYTSGRGKLTYAWAKSDFTATGTGGSSAFFSAVSSLTAGGVAPSDAAYMYITIEIQANGGPLYLTLSEVRVNIGKQALYITDSDPTITPAKITSTSGTLSIVPATKAAVTGDLTATGNIGFDGVIYGTSALTGPNINLGGTNTRLWTHSTSAADVAASTATTVSGVLITKVTAGQPSTNINGTATTDAFADALRNGGIAVDTTNNRGYFYSNGWKYANLTTPSDSRLKDEITEITGALDTLRQLVPVAFKWKAPEAHGRTDAVADDGERLGFIADQVATTDLAHWVETLGVDEREAHLVDTTEVLAVNIPQNEMEALVVQALLDIDTRLKALEAR
jgi:hypothetical protein